MQADYAVDTAYTKQLYLLFGIKAMLANARDQKLLHAELSPKKSIVHVADTSSASELEDARVRCWLLVLAFRALVKRVGC